jgi:hypothetical protein
MISLIIAGREFSDITVLQYMAVKAFMERRFEWGVRMDMGSLRRA